jgi:hypothetical protein
MNSIVSATILEKLKVLVVDDHLLFRKAVVCIIIFLFNSNEIFANMNDSLRASRIDKHSKYFLLTPGYAKTYGESYIKGYAVAAQFDYETFFIDKYSLTGRIGWNYSYIMFSNDAFDFSMGTCLKKYVKIKKFNSFYFFTGIVGNVVKINDLQSNTSSVSSIGITSSTGIGIHIIPLNRRKGQLSKFGLDFGYSILNFYYRSASPYTTFALKYRIN